MPKVMKRFKDPFKQSIGDLTAAEAIEDIGGLDPGEVADPGKDHNQGRGIYRRKLEEFSKLKDDDKHAALKETWKEVAMGTAIRAKHFVATCSPKDFGNLQRLVVSAAVGIDKAFPPKQEPLGPKFIVNMFGSLGQRAAAIATPPVPIIDAESQEVSWPDSSLMPTITSSQTSTET